MMPTAIESVKQALQILAPPLKFGDTDQIEALRFIEVVEECAKNIRACIAGGHSQTRKCWKCTGRGKCSECDAGCGECNGSGRVEGCAICLGNYYEETIVEARKLMEGDFEKVLSTGEGLYS